MKRVWGIILLMALIPFTVSARELEVKDNTFKMNVGGESYKSDNPILNVDQSTYLPLRELSNIFGKEITYKDNTIFIDTDYPESSGQGDNEIHTIKSSKYPDSKQSTAKIMIGGKEYKANNPVLMVNGVTYLSLRELANIFNEPIHFADGVIYVKGEIPEVPVEVEDEEEAKPEFTVVEELILKPDGTLWAWGDNKGGRISADIKEEQIAKPIKIMDDVLSIANANLVLKQDHTLWEFGHGFKKIMDNVARVTPENEWGTRGAIVTLDGDLYLYGIMCDADYYEESLEPKIIQQLDIDRSEIFKYDDSYNKLPIQPIKVKGISNVKDAMYRQEFEPAYNGMGIYHEAESLVVLKQDNSVWVCDDYVLFRYSDTDDRGPWGDITSFRHMMDNVKSIESAGLINAVIKQDNTLWGWGSTSYGGFGRGIDDNIKTPVKLMDNVKSTQISSLISFAITRNNELYTWGMNQAISYYFDGHRESGMYKIASGIDKVIEGMATYFIALKTNGDVWMYGWDGVTKVEEMYDQAGNLVPEEERVLIGSFGTDDVKEKIGYYEFESAEPIKGGAIDIGASTGERIAHYALREDGTVLVWGPNFIIDSGEDSKELEKEVRRPRVFINK